MEFQQDAFQQEYGHSMPHSMCKRKVSDFVMRRYKAIAKTASPELEVELDDCAFLFWEVIKLQGTEL